MNFFEVNWGEKLDQKACYDNLIPLVPKIGSAIAEYLDSLFQPDPFAWHQVTIIGHSIGAHIAAFVSRNVKNGKIATIIGLDPAAPLFTELEDEDRLNQDDAEYVEIIHTNGKCFGIHEDIGDADFYVNGGYEQPGCSDVECQHKRVIDLFAESVSNSNRLCAHRCDSETELEVHIGGEPGNNHKNVEGSYCVNTRANYPFGTGEACLIVKKRKKIKTNDFQGKLLSIFSSISG